MELIIEEIRNALQYPVTAVQVSMQGYNRNINWHRVSTELKRVCQLLDDLNYSDK